MRATRQKQTMGCRPEPDIHGVPPRSNGDLKQARAFNLGACILASSELKRVSATMIPSRITAPRVVGR